MQLTGIHHLTAISAKPRENLAFYTGLLGMRLVKKEMSRTALVLTEVMNMRRVRDYAAHGAEIHVFAMGEASDENNPAAALHVIEDQNSPVAQRGAGGVHHVAFRTPDETQYHAWTQRLNELRVPNSGEVDRFYFRSLYFREPSGILFEIATDGPGFATDEPMATLGERLAPPPFLEPRHTPCVMYERLPDADQVKIWLHRLHCCGSVTVAPECGRWPHRPHKISAIAC
jgi:catechol 2,3-dioxygenase-like lactoylglutathione lyase family enzyme